MNQVVNEIELFLCELDEMAWRCVGDSLMWRGRVFEAAASYYMGDIQSQGEIDEEIIFSNDHKELWIGKP